MAPSKWITAVLASCLSGSVLAAPTATTDNQIVKRASINDVSKSLDDESYFNFLVSSMLTRFIKKNRRPPVTPARMEAPLAELVVPLQLSPRMQHSLPQFREMPRRS